MTLGGAIWDTATLAGGNAPTGNITFTVVRLRSRDITEPCDQAGLFQSTIPVNGNGTYRSVSFTPVFAGDYQWSARYSGDAKNNVTSADCGDPAEQVVVGLGASPIGGAVTFSQVRGSNAAEPNCACTQSSGTSYPVNTESGYDHVGFDDISIPGRGIPLHFTHSYNSDPASVATDGPLGFGWTFSYQMSLFTDAATGAVTVRQEGGAEVTFTPSGGGFTAPPRVVATLARNFDGTFTFTRGAKEVLTFAAVGRLTSQRDLNGYVTGLFYNASDQLAAVTDPAGRALTLAWTGNRLRAVTDPVGRTVTFDFADGAGNLTDVTDVGGGNTHFTYDGSHRLLTLRSPNQAGAASPMVVTNHYDSAGRIDWQSDQADASSPPRTTFLDYTSVPGATKVTDPKGNVRLDEYAYGMRRATTQGYGTPQAAMWRYTYDPATLGIATVTDPNDNVTTMTYDERGNQLSLTDPLNRTTGKTWNVRNDLTSLTDPLRVTTSRVFDGAGNLQSSSTPLTGTALSQDTTYHYDDPAHPGDVTSVTDPDGFTSTFRYDAQGNRDRVTDPVGRVSTLSYNGIGWMTSTVSPTGNVPGSDPVSFTTTFEHDRFGRATVVRDPLWNGGTPSEHQTVRQYDANGNLHFAVDGNNRRTTYTYDATNQLTTTLRADGTTMRTDYWPDGTVRRQIDGAGQATTYDYDPLRRVRSVADPLGHATGYTHDGAGNVVAKTDPGGDCTASPKRNCTTYAYDAGDQLKSVSYSDGVTPNVANIDYDAAGRRVSMADGTGTSTWEWDSLRRLRRSRDGAGQTVGYDYDLRGNLTALAYPGDQVVTRAYDSAGQLRSVTDWLGHRTTFDYDPNANLLTQTFPGGGKDAFSSDRADRLMGITAKKGDGSPLASFSYGRDGADMLNSVTSSGVPSDDHSYGYTSLNQLKSVDAASYAYDPADNLTRMVNGTTQAFDVANQLCWTGSGAGGGCGAPPDGATAFTYDSRGNRTATTPPTGSPTTYRYDQANRLVSATVPAPDTPIAGRYTPLTPARTLDTRNGTGGISQPVGPGATVEVQVTGRGGVPTAGVSAVAVNVTVTEPTAESFLTIYPAGTQRPLAANLNFTPGKTVPNLVVVKVGQGGKVSMFNNAGSTHVVYDVAGWYSSQPAGNDGRYQPLVPARILDTRNGTGGSSVRLGPGGKIDLAVSGRGGVAATGASAAVLNVAVTNTTQTSFLTVYPAGQSLPLAANLNFAAGDTVGNRVVARLGTGGKVTLYNNAGAADVVVDVGGWYTDASVPGTSGTYSALAPARLLDTRDGTGGVSGPVTGGTSVDVQITGRVGIPAAGVSAVILNATVTQPVGPGYLTISPTGTPRPLASDLNYATGETRPNLVVVKVGTSGKISLFTSTGTHAVFDVAGWYHDSATATVDAAYAYSGDGLRTSKTIGGVVNTFTWDTAGDLPLLLQEDGNRYIYGPDGLPMERVDASGAVSYYHRDQIGSIRLVTDTTGSVAASYTYDSYGRLVGSTGPKVQPFGFTGQYTDGETGFQYLRARYYDAAVGQFISRDPIEGITRSPYSYVEGNPLNATDPSGLRCADIDCHLQKAIDCLAWTLPHSAHDVGCAVLTRPLAWGFGAFASVLYYVVPRVGTEIEDITPGRFLYPDPCYRHIYAEEDVDGGWLPYGVNGPWTRNQLIGLREQDIVKHGSKLEYMSAVTLPPAYIGSPG